jgi:hypothetical protein
LPGPIPGFIFQIFPGRARIRVLFSKFCRAGPGTRARQNPAKSAGFRAGLPFFKKFKNQFKKNFF